MKSLFIRDIAGHHMDELKELPSELVNDVSSAPSRRTDAAIRIYAALPKVDWTEKIKAQFASWADIIATAMKKGAGASEIVANNTEDEADFAKFLPGGVRVIFQLVALSARLVVMYAEANSGIRELPNLLAEVMDLLDFVAVAYNITEFKIIKMLRKVIKYFGSSYNIPIGCNSQPVMVGAGNLSYDVNIFNIVNIKSAKLFRFLTSDDHEYAPLDKFWLRIYSYFGPLRKRSI